MHKIKDFLNKKRCRKLKLLNQKGFSLIEILVVITLMGIITAIAVPSYTKYKKQANEGVVKSSLGAIGRGAAACITLGNRSSCTSLTQVGVTCPSGLTCAANSGAAQADATKPLCYEVTSGGATGAKGCVSISLEGAVARVTGITGTGLACSSTTPYCVGSTVTCPSGCTVTAAGGHSDTCNASGQVVQSVSGDTAADTCGTNTYNRTLADLPKCHATNGTCS